MLPESEGKNVPNNEVSFPQNDEITTSQLTDAREMADLQYNITQSWQH